MVATLFELWIHNSGSVLQVFSACGGVVGGHVGVEGTEGEAYCHSTLVQSFLPVSKKLIASLSFWSSCNKQGQTQLMMTDTW